jgi:hypothetical protein
MENVKRREHQAQQRPNTLAMYDLRCQHTTLQARSIPGDPFDENKIAPLLVHFKDIKTCNRFTRPANRRLIRSLAPLWRRSECGERMIAN